MESGKPMSFQRWRLYQPSKTALFWTFIGGAAVAVILGFTWGGWVTGRSASSMAQDAADEARAQLAATVCVERFLHAPDAQAKLTALKATSLWERDTFIEKGGWVTLPGIASPVEDSAGLCAQKLADATVPAGDAAAQIGKAPSVIH